MKRGLTGRFACYCCLLLLLLTMPARGERYGDVVINAASPPQASTTHGYAEYRFTLLNNSTSKDHVVKLELPKDSYAYGNSIRRMTRTVVIPAQTEAKVSLWQPALAMNGGGVRVTIDGRLQRSGVSLNVAGHGENYYGYSGSSMFVLISRSVGGDVRDKLEKLIEQIRTAASSGTTHYYTPSGYGVDTNLVRAESDAADWSANWLSYTRYDGLLVTPADLRAMPPDTRRAVWAYVEAGGSLMVMGEMDVPATWREAQRTTAFTEQYDVGFGKAWSVKPGWVPDWTESDFKSFENELWRPVATRWAARMSVEDANKTFPVVDELQIPARGMLVLMIVFALVLGPVNLLVLTKLKKRIWTLATVPAISLLFSVAVFGYAVAAEGFGASGRAATITLLDEDARRATTIGWLAYYSPLTPGGGLHFSTDTEVTPQYENMWGNEGSSRMIDWSADQHLTAGWITARVPAHLLIRKSSQQRQRLSTSRDEAGNVVVVNGLGADIVNLYLADEDGKVYRAGNIPAGEKHTLELMKDVHAFSEPPLGSLYRDAHWLVALEKLRGENAPAHLANGTYIAELADAAFTERGLENLKSWKAEAVVYGLLPQRRVGE